METRKMIVGMVMAVLVLMSGVSWGATQYYVSPDGNDNNSGTTWATAFATIGKGITTASNGDIIDVNEGTYYEAIDYGGKAIKVQSTDPNDWDTVAATIIDANDPNADAVMFNSGEDANAVLKGLTVTGAWVGVYADSVGSVISRCILQGNRTGVKYTQNSTGTLIVNNKIYDSNGRGVFGNKGDATIKNNWIYDSDKGIKLSGGASADIYNNTIVNNISYGIDKDGQGVATISNCIIWDCNDDLKGCSATYSCISDCCDASGTGNICGDGNDPNFVNAASDDYHILRVSPCVDAGDPCYVPDINETDIDGDARVRGTAVDMGADEDPPDWYVDCTVSGGTGKSWDYAFKYLQDALANSELESGHVIWVADGTYYPDEGDGQTPDDRTATFNLKTGVTIVGGYAGYGATNPDERDTKTYETILSGDIDGDGLLDGENSEHIVTGAGNGADEAVLDGFTIKGGNASATVNSCGGGMYMWGGWPPDSMTLKNCVIKDNRANRYGGGVYSEYVTMTIENCFFVDNTGGSGGGLFIYHTNPTLVNCVFSRNKATSPFGGGAMRGVTSSPTITNCTFSNNVTAGLYGGVLASHDAVVTNCIFWGNSDSTGNGESAQLQIGGTATVTYNCIQGLVTGGDFDSGSNTNNIGDGAGEAPFFIDESDPDGVFNVFGTIDDGLIIWEDSPCADSGSNAAAEGIAEDITGLSRIVNGTVDMGAYESRESQRPYFLRISGGEYHTLVLKLDRTVWACGKNDSGQLGLGNTQSPKNTIEQVLGGDMGTTNLERIVGIDGGWYHSLAVDVDCNVWAWGENTHGQIGDDPLTTPAPTPYTTPVEVNDTGGSNPLTDIRGISAGRSGEYSLAFDGSGSAWSWGENDRGQLGDGTIGTDRYTPVQVVGEGGTGDLENIIDVDTGANHSIALDDSGHVWCWGDNVYGQLGNGESGDAPVPTPVPVVHSTPTPTPIPLENIVDVAVASDYSTSSYALDANGCVWAWGCNFYGELGQDSDDDNAHPNPLKVLKGDMQVAGNFLKNIVAISAGREQVLALDEDGNVWAWGMNDSNQLGDGTNTDRPSPVQVKRIADGYGYLTDIIYIDAGYEHSMAIDIDNNFWVWGDNGSYRLGLGPAVGKQGHAQIMFTEVPTNDDCANAIEAYLHTATEEHFYYGSIVFATNGSVWYKFRPASGGTTTFSLCDSNYWTLLNIYTGDCGSLTLWKGEADNDYCGGGTAWKTYISDTVTGGTWYYIEVAGYVEVGNYVLKITQP